MNIQLPRPADRYDARNEAEARRTIELALARLPQGSSSGLAARRQVIKTTNVLAVQAEEQGTIAMGAKTQALLLLTTNRACRLRLYASDGARSQDHLRSLSTDPSAGRGALAEFIWLTAHTKQVSPVVVLYNADDTVSDLIYYAVQNLSGSSGAITITFTVLTLEGEATGTGGGAGGGGGSTPTATDTITGTVRTDVTEGDPIVYVKATTDTLLAGKSDTGHTHATLPSADEKDALAGTAGTPDAANPYVTDADTRLPTQDEADALVGTNGMPSAANPYVTDSDPRLTGGGGGGGGTGAKFPLVPPASPTAYDDEWPGTTLDAKWGWVNQGAATAVVKDGVLALTAPAAASDTVRGLIQAVPAGAWAIEAFLSSTGAFANFWLAALAVYNSANGRLEFFGQGWESGLAAAEVQRYNSVTAFNTTLQNNTNWNTPLGGWRGAFYRIAFDGTNTLTYSVSANGKQFETITTSLVSAHLLAPTHFGFVVKVGGAGSRPVTLVSYYFRKVA